MSAQAAVHGLDLALERSYPPARRGRVVLWGLLASYPFGGMIWQVLHHLAGLRRLGFDVWYVEDFHDRPVLCPRTLSPTMEFRPNLALLEGFLEQIGLSERWVFRAPDAAGPFGALDLAGLERLYAEADAVFNLCGAQEIREEHRRIRCLVQLETDPVGDQISVARGDRELIEQLDLYHHLFTYGQNFGAPDCRVPIERYQWIPTRPPVCVDWWSGAPPPRTGALTTIANWKHEGNDLEWQGETWRWSKHLEFQRFRDLPRRSALPLELAMGGIDSEDRAMMLSHGWRFASSEDLECPAAYRRYVLSSLGEFTVSKEQVVRPRSGWFSDRSACYLAAGRPVVTQDTGAGRLVPTGEGLFVFSDEDEALAAIEAVARDFPRHSAAALEIAREYFDTSRVLGDIVERIGL